MTYVQSVLSDFLSYPAAKLLLFCAPFALPILYRLFLHPLSHSPGPLLARITPLYIYTICYLGIECRLIEQYHRKYKTSVLRIAPNAVSISDGTALHPIYVAGGGFPKSLRYENFKVGGLHTIFSSRDSSYRDVRAKAVAPIFAMGRVRAASDPEGIVGNCVGKFIERLKNEKKNAMMLTPRAAKIDVLGLTYRFMMDSTTGYLFNRTYGALDERLVSPLAVEASLGMASKTRCPRYLSYMPF